MLKRGKDSDFHIMGITGVMLSPHTSMYIIVLLYTRHKKAFQKALLYRDDLNQTAGNNTFDRLVYFGGLDVISVTDRAG